MPAGPILNDNLHVSCDTCHGIANHQDEVPYLQGMGAVYLEKQLQDFRLAKTRKHPLMTPIAKQLSPADMHRIAVYYSHLAKLKLPQAPLANKKTEQLGGELFFFGSFKTMSVACSACHGPHAEGNDHLGIPALSNQPSLYLQHQLLAFHHSKRVNDVMMLMRGNTWKVEPQDIIAVTTYLKYFNN